MFRVERVNICGGWQQAGSRNYEAHTAIFRRMYKDRLSRLSRPRNIFYERIYLAKNNDSYTTLKWAETPFISNDNVSMLLKSSRNMFINQKKRGGVAWWCGKTTQCDYCTYCLVSALNSSYEELLIPLSSRCEGNLFSTQNSSGKLLRLYLN